LAFYELSEFSMIPH